MYKRQLLNGVFYTANNIAYSALTSLITKNSKERVQMGSYRFIFAFSTSLLIQAITVGFVDKCGGDAAAWRTVAIIYAIIGLVVNTISALSVKELPEEELNEGAVKDDNEKYGMVQAFKLLVKNKYYMQFMYLWLPLIFDVLIMFVLSRMNVEDANKKLKAEKEIAADEVTDASDIN